MDYENTQEYQISISSWIRKSVINDLLTTWFPKIPIPNSKFPPIFYQNIFVKKFPIQNFHEDLIHILHTNLQNAIGQLEICETTSSKIFLHNLFLGISFSE